MLLNHEDDRSAVHNKAINAVEFGYIFLTDEKSLLIDGAVHLVQSATSVKWLHRTIL